MEPSTLRTAVPRSPRRFLLSWWPWRAVAYLATGAALGALTAAVVAMAIVLSIYIVGLVLLAASLLMGISIARWERTRLRLVDEEPTFDPHVRVTERGLRAWLRVRLRERVTWRELGYAVVNASILCWIDALVLLLCLGTVFFGVEISLTEPGVPTHYRVIFVVASLVFLPIAMYIIAAWAAGRAEIVRAVLSPRDAELDRMLNEVTLSRSALAAAFDAERRRIERDLHDGAQQRLIALSMSLGMAKLDLPAGSAAADRVGDAQQQAKLALQDLRDLIRGIHPQILAERGLAAAVDDVAARSPIPVDVQLPLPRMPADVESTAYFAVCEALANVARHAGASQVSVSGRVAESTLFLDVTDDGSGGAAPEQGTGLAGLGHRLAVLGGTMMLDSPAGGGTRLRMEIPCRHFA
ncbi:sensor domain-containing protein [Rhodococcus sp. F64268]|uniref:sensor histidine kinase n=1 Tax=Rhodococcus sp. F64268 TaxID=2926402 RepID=UPI001FF462BA|nr:sensor histidine kinase [Rhodococcus sp. F64268]MCK0091857.1 sensor domain-containing protein [Rhodococcus sp. F64268]